MVFDANLRMIVIFLIGFFPLMQASVIICRIKFSLVALMALPTQALQLAAVDRMTPITRHLACPLEYPIPISLYSSIHLSICYILYYDDYQWHWRSPPSTRGKCDRGTFPMSVPHPTPPLLTSFGANKAEAKISIFTSGFWLLQPKLSRPRPCFALCHSTLSHPELDFGFAYFIFDSWLLYIKHVSPSLPLSLSHILSYHLPALRNSPTSFFGVCRKCCDLFTLPQHPIKVHWTLIRRTNSVTPLSLDFSLLLCFHIGNYCHSMLTATLFV